MRKLFANLLLVLATFAICGLIGEAVVRLAFKQQTVLFPRYHTDYQYGEYTLRGIRPSSEFWHTSADGTWRLATDKRRPRPGGGCCPPTADGTWRFATTKRGLRDTRDFPYDKPPGVVRVLSLGDS